MKFIFHKVGSNERWDYIAYKYYGNSFKTKSIIEANPNIPINSIISEGTTLKIPIIENIEMDTSDLPPWKQVQQ